MIRETSLATLGIFSSASAIILRAALGTLVYKEPFGAREVIGISLAIAPVVVMGRSV